MQSFVEYQLLKIPNQKNNHLRQLFDVCYGEATQLDQELDQMPF